MRRVEQQGGTRLPTIRAMAKESGVSTVTLTAAVAELKRRGTIDATQGSGIRILRSPTAPATADSDAGTSEPQRDNFSNKRSWVWVKRQIAHDILRGVYPPASRLPPMKVLKGTYGACFTTVKRALDTLCEERRLTRETRGYRIYSSGADPGGCILVVSRCRSVQQLVQMSLHSHDFWRTLEMDCNMRKVHLEVVPVRPYSLLHKYTHVKDRVVGARGRPVLGVVVYLVGIYDEMLDALLGNLTRLRVPVVLYDESERWTLEQLKKRSSGNTRLRLIQLGIGTAPGSAMGNHLLGNGHRSIACFLTDISSRWSRERAHGIQSAFAEAGIDSQPKLVVLGSKMRAEARAGFQDIVARCINTDIAFGPDSPTNVAAFQRALQVFGRGTTCSTLSRTFFLMAAKHLRDEFAEVLADPHITAWVGINDSVALIAKQFLQSYGGKAANRIDIAGFDDNLAAVCAGITSYDFNVRAAVHEIVRQILDCSPETSAYVRIPGTVVGRDSNVVFV